VGARVRLLAGLADVILCFIYVCNTCRILSSLGGSPHFRFLCCAGRFVGVCGRVVSRLICYYPVVCGACHSTFLVGERG